MRLKFSFPIIAILILSACSSEEPATETVADEPVIEPVAEPAPPSEDDAADDERPQAVEESGGEPEASEAEDRPIILAQTDSAASSSRN